MKTMLMSFFVLLCLLLTIFAYDYWDSNVVEESQYADVIALSQKSVITELNSPSSKNLVPQGSLVGINDTDEIEISYLVELNENTELNVFVEEVFITKNNQVYLDENDSLSFDFQINKINDSQAEVRVFVHLNMPENQEHYELISNSNISFNLIFNQEII